MPICAINQRCSWIYTKHLAIYTTIIWWLLTENQKELRKALERLADRCRNNHLRINTSKTKIKKFRKGEQCYHHPNYLTNWYSEEPLHKESPLYSHRHLQSWSTESVTRRDYLQNWRTIRSTKSHGKTTSQTSSKKTTRFQLTGIRANKVEINQSTQALFGGLLISQHPVQKHLIPWQRQKWMHL